MKALVTALLFSLVSGSVFADDASTARVRLAYVVFAKNYCGANIKWVYSTTASLKQAELEHSNVLSVNYAALNMVISTAGKMSDDEVTSTCADALEFLRGEDALLK